MGNVAVDSCCAGEKKSPLSQFGSSLTCETTATRQNKEGDPFSPNKQICTEKYIRQHSRASTATLDKSPRDSIGKKHMIDLNSFELIKVLGRGSFGKVFLARHKQNNDIAALKKMRKKEMADRFQIENILTEKKILQKSDHPFIVKLKYAFQNEGNIYLGMEYLSGGELFFHLRNSRRFGEKNAWFYAAEVLLGLEYLREGLGVIYRDLKPENVLLDADGHIKITDFGLSKYYQIDTLAKSFAGTPEYFAPEVVLGTGYGPAVDMWSFGCFVYEIMVGEPPFQADNRAKLFKMIIDAKVQYPSCVTPTAKDLISKLLAPNPTERLGYKSIQEVKEHPFFEGTDWNKLLNKEIPPPFKPILRSTTDVGNFDEDFTHEIVKETPAKSAHYKVVDFSYIRKDPIMEQISTDNVA